jgi:hypothetical protein
MHKIVINSIGLIMAATLIMVLPVVAPVDRPMGSYADCFNYATQAEAQAAADTRDSDGDGIFCESLPCPCATGTPAPAPSKGAPAPAKPTAGKCTKTKKIIKVRLERERYPNILAHIDTAVTEGWPRVLRINRVGADERRDKALAGIPTKPGFDRDEWPAAMARKTWRTHVAYVPSSENRSAGSKMGNALSAYCDGVRFTIVGI